MFQNPVLFQIGTRQWTLGPVCMLLGLMLLLIAGGLLAVLIVQHGETRRLDAREASRVAFNAGRAPSELAPIHGPARGVEARVSFTIGDLRRARRAGDSLLFWGGPLMMMLWSAAFGLFCIGGAAWSRSAIPLWGLLVVVPLLLMAAFMPWAAVYTELE
jgi:hypothetical protein